MQLSRVDLKLDDKEFVIAVQHMEQQDASLVSFEVNRDTDFIQRMGVKPKSVYRMSIYSQPIGGLDLTKLVAEIEEKTKC